MGDVSGMGMDVHTQGTAAPTERALSASRQTNAIWSSRSGFSRIWTMSLTAPPPQYSITI